MDMESFYNYLKNSVKVEEVLLSAEKYLAHIPKPGDNSDKKVETLAEHMSLVVNNVLTLTNLHGLDSTIGRLIKQVANQLQFEKIESGEDWLMKLFTNAIVFHDFGKVNAYFQVDRMKNQDPFFQKLNDEIFTPRYGHSELGAYLFSVFHLEQIPSGNHSEADQLKMVALAFLFSNTILLHHSPRLKQPQKRVENSQFIKHEKAIASYLQLFPGFPIPDLSEWCFEKIDVIFNEFERLQADFALFALLRLNFSLLTASDYMATWHYGYEMEMNSAKHWGVLDVEKQLALFQAAKRQKSFNTLAFNLFEAGNYHFKHPVEKSGENLNLLRTEMTVELLDQLAKNKDKRLFYLEAPTGGGKTNLSMLAVTELMKENPELNKVYYVFPFTTLITQTHKSIKETLGLSDDEIALLHSRIGFQTLEEADRSINQVNYEGEESWNDGLYGNRKRDFLQNHFALFPFTLLSHVRFFDILKSDSKEDIYLMHRLANSIIVLDELQSYNPKLWDKMLHLLNEYGYYFNIRFILMSATLPRLDRIDTVRRIAGGRLPVVTDLLPNPKRYFLNPNFRDRVTFRFDLLDDSNTDFTLEGLSQTVLEKSKDRAELPESEGRVFTLVEFIFKKSATEFKIEIEKKDTFFDEIFVLSGTILESRRQEIIAFLKRHQTSKGLKVLLITTQVVEAGVDIDMDLGFKNISLIDSDEQLAGRINRNVQKENCEVWLFKINEPGLLYKQDFRLEAMRRMPTAERRAILQMKTFDELYERVFQKIEERNHSQHIENFQHDYQPLFKKLDFAEIHNQFKLIEQSTLSIFVPLSLPVLVENENGEVEPFFTQHELEFLRKSGIWNPESKAIEGAVVWQFYRAICDEKDQPKDFIVSKIEQKTLQGILSKFTFSIFDSPKNRIDLRCYCDETECFENYFVLTRYQENGLYDIKSGLDESRLHQADNYF